jgi:hypothetical protein
MPPFRQAQEIRLAVEIVPTSPAGTPKPKVWSRFLPDGFGAAAISSKYSISSGAA